MKDETRLQWWQKAITLDFMSSEESADSSYSENETYIVNPIPWQSEKLTDMFNNKLDPIVSSSQGKCMRQPRIEGSLTQQRAPVRRYKDCLWTLHSSVHPVAQQSTP